jgi:hypothetical protein
MIDEDHCVYVKRFKNKFVILSLYVDDILLASNNKEYVQTIKESLIRKISSIIQKSNTLILSITSLET